MAYGLDKQPNENRNILVFDLGGATYDISILSYEHQQINILSTSVDYRLGGENFDKALADYIINGEYNRDELLKSREIKNEIKLACENVKKILSVSEETILRLFLSDKKTFINKRITRHAFEEMCMPLFERLRNPINEALLKAKLNRDQINDVILVGGSTKMPRIKVFVREMFPHFFYGRISHLLVV